MKYLKEQIQNLRDYVLRLRRDFHNHPELSLKEFRTASVIEQELDKWGISHRRVGETGVLGIIRGEKPGNRVVALRADIDALPIQETSNAEYCSQTDGVMHACGHDVHTACLLAAAKVLQDNRTFFAGEIRLIFQPAEEIGKGAAPFLEAGALNGAERVFGLHVASDLQAGLVGIKPGLNNASVDHFQIVVHGKSAHVSTPQMGVDALYIASHIVIALQALITRCSSPVEPVIIGVGKLNAGTAYNALAKSAELEGTTRTISLEMRDQIRRQVTETAQKIASLYGGSADVVWDDFASPLVNWPQVCEEVETVVEKTWGAGHVVTERQLSLGGDNFAEFILDCPGAYVYLGTANPDYPQTLCSAHNGNFDVDEEALVLGAGLYAEYAYWWLTKE